MIDERNDFRTTHKNVTRFRGRVAYDGTGFSGWQFQPKGRTVQGELESVLSQRFNTTVRIVGAGRTDAGVHARGQAFHFDLNPECSTDALNDLPSLQRSINRMLRRDVQVWNLSRAPMIQHENSNRNRPLPWHAIANAEKKLYSYRIHIGPALDPIHRYTRHHVHDHFQFDSVFVDKENDSDENTTAATSRIHLSEILQHYEGKHDFRAFSGAIEQNARKKNTTAANTDTIRTVRNISVVVEPGENNYRIDIFLNGALYKMVRNMVGTALDVCRGALSETQMLQLLHQKTETENNSSKKKYLDRDCNPCRPAPPEGLTLEKVFYEDDSF